MIWEYKKESVKNGFMSVDDLNAIGAEGWENYEIQSNVYFFKRVVEPTAKNLITGTGNAGALPTVSDLDNVRANPVKFETKEAVEKVYGKHNKKK